MGLWPKNEILLVPSRRVGALVSAYSSMNAQVRAASAHQLVDLDPLGSLLILISRTFCVGTAPIQSRQQANVMRSFSGRCAVARLH